jgi:NTP pyrophosphatase (non-canonical NTP hydrolase)
MQLAVFPPQLINLPRINCCPDDAEKQDVAEELTAILAYALMLAHHYDLDLGEIVRQKIDKNALKYPVDKAKGNARKYTDF